MFLNLSTELEDSAIQRLKGPVVISGTSLQCRSILGGQKLLVLCLYCCNCHLCYDGGRLGRVKIVTLRVGARVKEGKRGGEKVDFLQLALWYFKRWTTFQSVFPNSCSLFDTVHIFTMFDKRCKVQDWYAVHLRRLRTASFPVWSLGKK